LRFPLKRYEFRSRSAFPALRERLKPYLLLRLRNSTNPDLHVSCWAQIDSGSDLSLFPSQLAELIGLQMPSERSLDYFTIGRVKHTAHFFPLNVEILDFDTDAVSYSFTMDAGFSTALDYEGSGILGMVGFFSQFRVTFDRAFVEIEPF